MNRKLTIILMSLVSAELSLSQCQWMVQRGPDPATRSAICFVDSLHGWVGRSPNYRDGMLRTTNGGRSWDTVNFTFNIGAVASISFIDTLHGWCTVPSLTKLYKTVDGGLTWTEFYQAPDYRLFFEIIQFVDSIHGFGVGADTVFNVTRTWRTSDGGLTWSSVSIPNANVRARMRFVDTLHGWAVGLGLYATTNGGQSWSRQNYDSATVQGLYGVDFVNEKEGWCCSGQNGWIIHTLDGGVTWTDEFFIDLPNGVSNSGISFTDSLNGWVFGSTFYQGDSKEVIYTTSDGGNSWSQESIGLSRYLGNGIAIDRCHVWAVSDGDGSILSSDMMTGIVGGESRLPETIKLSQNYPNPYNPTTTFEFELSERDHIIMRLFNQEGQEVQTIIDDMQDAGLHTIKFDASRLSSGVYYIHLSTSRSHVARKSILVK